MNKLSIFFFSLNVKMSTFIVQVDILAFNVPTEWQKEKLLIFLMFLTPRVAIKSTYIIQVEFLSSRGVKNSTCKYRWTFSSHTESKTPPVFYRWRNWQKMEIIKIKSWWFCLPVGVDILIVDVFALHPLAGPSMGY